MAKKKFINGTIVPSDWLNSVFGGGGKAGWTALNAYALGEIIEPEAGKVFRCVTAGTSGASAPSWPGFPAPREEVSDGTVTWQSFYGHYHDGSGTKDGSAPKILLTDDAEIDGVLHAGSVVHRTLPSGLELSNDVTDSDHDIVIANGVCSANDYSRLITLGSPIIKRIDANWSAGSNQGGIPTTDALYPDTWFYVFLLYNPTTGAVDAGFDIDLNATFLKSAASGFTKHWRIGCVLTDGSSNIMPFKQHGDRFKWVTPPQNLNGVSIETNGLRAFSVPGGISVRALLAFSSDPLVSGQYAEVQDYDQSAGTVVPAIRATESIGWYESHALEAVTNTSSEVYVKADDGANKPTVSAWTLGWIDPRGKPLY